MKTTIDLRLFFSFLFAFCYSLSFATVWYVHPDSSMNNIDVALDSCAQHDTVLVGPGTYYENIIWPNTQGIDLISETGSVSTIIDGNNSGCVIAFLSGNNIDSSTVIQGFTIQHGFSTNAGGIRCDSTNSPMIISNTITSNATDYWGGGILCRFSSPTIYGNTITNNTSTYVGAGLSCIMSSAVIYINSIEYNHSTFPGGGIWCDGWSSINLSGNSINDNISDWFGGGICMYMSSAVIDSCDILGNTNMGIYCDVNCTLLIHNCNIHNNTGYGIFNEDASSTVNAEYNWWGDSTGPYHPSSNPGGLGDSVSDYVDFIPWLYWPGIEDKPIVNSVIKNNLVSATVFAGSIILPADESCRIFDITGRQVHTFDPAPGIYFIEVYGRLTQKVIKVR